MTKQHHILRILVVLALVASAKIARADIPCPTPDGPGNEGNSAVDMNCWDFTAFAGQQRINDIATAFTAAGGTTQAVAVGTAYGTLDSRMAITQQIDDLLRPRTFQDNRAAIRGKWRDLFAINNPAYLSRIGATNNAANNVRMARVWLPINTASRDAARTRRDTALATWQANRTDANAQAYWNAQRMVVAYEEMVGATQDIIDGN
jgi:hypothetical protein